MRRADRLFQIIQFLRTRRLTTARWLSEKLEVSERTIYRDIQDLIKSGVPVDGEAGVGYILRKEYDLPPIMLDLGELTSLVIGAKMASSLGGNIKQNAEKALSKLNSILPAKRQNDMTNIQVYAPFVENRYGTMIDLFNHAIHKKRMLSIQYQKPQDNLAENRTIYPLGLFFWNDRWTMVGWCLLRNSFRHFRLDRIGEYMLLDDTFTLSKEQNLETFFSLVIPKPKY